ncbi:MAG: DNA-binding transcriptional LysR family regulator [Cyclobacteriaceae bacterium]|jgi:DNA-binding transcriptional LysR family regulator
MHYTLHQLQIFLKVAQLQSVTKASEALFLSQPAVSIQLKKFQDQFDIPLTEVIGRKIYITDFGKDIAQVSERILNEAELIKHKTMEYKGYLVGQLRLSIVSTGKYVMPYFLEGFLKKYKTVDLVMDVTNKGKVIKSMEKNELDFALVSVLPERIAIDKLELMDNKLYLVAGKDFEIQKEYVPSILESFPIIYRESGSATRQAMEEFISMNKLVVKKKIELTSNEAVKQAVIAGLGLSIMPLIGIKNELKEGSLRLLPLKKLPITTKWNLIWLKNKHFSPVATAYLNYVKTNRDQIINNHFSWTLNN